MKMIKSFIIKVVFLSTFFTGFNSMAQSIDPPVHDLTNNVGENGLGASEDVNINAIVGNPDVPVNNLGEIDCVDCIPPSHEEPEDTTSENGNSSGAGKTAGYISISDVILSPNPIMYKHFTIDLNLLESKKCSFKMYNSNGQQVHYFGTQLIQIGQQRLNFDLPETIHSGIYWVVIEGDDRREVIEVIVQ